MKDKKNTMFYDVQTIFEGHIMPSGDYLYVNDFEEMLNDDDFVVMQFTGLYDKNGKEIYEGDIVDYEITGVPKKQRDVVIFEDGKFEPVPCYEYCDDSYFTKEYCNFEVVGNIFENPELLK